MSHRASILMLTGLFLACGGGETEQEEAAPAVPTTDEEALAELPNYWETHLNMGHPDMVAGIYADSSFVLNADGGVASGKEEVTAWLTELTSAGAQADISAMHQMILGDMAVTMGTYDVTMTPAEGAEPVDLGGSYLSVASKETGDWKIVGSISNYDEARPEGWEWGEQPDEAPPENGTMADLTTGFKRHWDLTHPDMVADFYTDDAVVAYSNRPMMHGKEAVTAALQESHANPTTITIHNVDTWMLEDGYALDGGWYELHAKADGTPVQNGMYMHLLRQQEDGTWKIQWAVTNAYPPSAM